MTNRAQLLLAAAPLLLAACSSGRTRRDRGRRAASRCGPPPSRSATCPRTSSSPAPSSPAPRCRWWPRCRRACCASCATRARASAKGEILAVLDDTDYRLANDRARAALAVAEANRAHAQAEKERADNLLKTGGITDRDHLSAQVALQVGEASLAQARAEVAIAGQQLARTEVRAPFAGRVAKRFPDPGSMLAAGAPLFTLVDDSVLEFQAQVASRDLAKVRLGAPVRLSIDALPDARDRGARRAGRAARGRALALVPGRGRGAGAARPRGRPLRPRGACAWARWQGRWSSRRRRWCATAPTRPPASRVRGAPGQGREGGGRARGRGAGRRSRSRAASPRATSWCWTRRRRSPRARRSTSRTAAAAPRSRPRSSEEPRHVPEQPVDQAPGLRDHDDGGARRPRDRLLLASSRSTSSRRSRSRSSP